MAHRSHIRHASSPKGYVLFVVLVIGLAASVAAMSLINTRGGAQVAAMHSEVGDRSAILAEAGMQRGIFYLNDVLGNFGDFDSALDTDLNSDCSAPASTDLRPDTTADTAPWPGDDIVEWTGASEELIGSRYFTCASMNGGRYCVAFEDDDDDANDTDEWKDTTGNNEESDGDGTCGGSCTEGPAGVESSCGNDNGGDNNRLRDRNRAIWIVSVGIYPDVPYAEATHKTTLRRMHMAPRFPTLAGLSVKGNVSTTSGSSEWLACSDVASVAVDGHAGAHTSSKMCASGYSRAHSWDGDGSANTVSACEDLTASPRCQALAFGAGVNIDPVKGKLETPGPRLDPVPDPWDNAKEWIDFDRPCTFWVDNGIPSTSAHGLTGGEHSLWVWDSEATRGPGGARCGDYEQATPIDGEMPGPPDPSATPGGTNACASTSNANCWRGCWTPLLFMDRSIPTPMVPGQTVILPGTTTYSQATHKCYQPLWRSSAPGLGHFVLERQIVDTSCNWYPNDSEGFYQTCSTSELCYEWGQEDAVSHGLAGHTDPLNQRLSSAGIGTFPPGTVLRKPAWATECQVLYPPPEANIGTPATHNCTTCAHTVTPVVLAPDTSGTDYRRPLQRALAGPDPTGGQSQVWFRINTLAQASAVPAGVYFFSKSFSLPGSNFNWAAAGHANTGATNPALPHLALNQWPLVTIMNDESMNLQFGGYSFGIGQEHAGAASNGIESMWGRYPTWITGETLTMQGGNDAATAGSVFAKNGATWSGGGEYYVFGEFYTDGDFSIGGGSQFYWMYQVRLSDQKLGGYSGANTTQSFIAQ